MSTAIQKQNHSRLSPAFMISLSIVATIFVSFSLIFQQSYAEDYKLNIDIKNEDEANTEADLSIKTDDDTLETTVKLNDNPEKIKEEVSGEPEDKVKVCLEDDDFKECQTKNLPKDEDSTLKFTLEYEA
jgi:cell division protein FtsL